ncbi:MAG: PIN domain-containing protein [Bifidobacteriaceae bacterium]|jgi:predicted nucleic acid-binding protein|nr:PIN domain-containing protein [Bifidobacteriaceae bacterium]
MTRSEPDAGAAFLDTNVLVYAYDTRYPAKQEVARQTVRAGGLFVSAQVLGEFYWTVTRKLATPLRPEVAREVVDRWPSDFVIPVTAGMVRDAVATSQRSQLSYWDALIVAAAAAAGCGLLLTEDLQDGGAVSGVRIANPFAGL